MKPHREFWIRGDWQVILKKPENELPHIHVIDYAAYEKALKELNEFKSQCAILIEKVNTITALVFELENRNKIDKLGEQDDEAAK